MLREEKKAVIKAVEGLGHRVTAADVASKTGLSLSQSESQLNTIASETGGHLEVSKAGDIAYRFKSNFQSAYFATGLKAALVIIFENIFGLILYLLKISFGIFLCLSLFIVVTAFIIFAFLSSQFSNERDNFNLRELCQFFNFLIIRDLIFGGAAKTEAEVDTEAEAEKSEQAISAGPVRGNFFVNCFAFLFGSINPNAHLAEFKWQLAAQAIRENSGVVIKEQLAPYIGPALDDADSILPLLARFDGKPVVTPSGNIAYVFPSLQVTTGPEQKPARESFLAAATRQGYLVEERWKFSSLPENELRAVYAIAGLNLFGALWLYFIFNHLCRLNFVWTEVMVMYGALFFIVPIIRFLFQTMLNQQIKKRNAKRLAAAKVVSEPNMDILAKLLERQALAPSVPVRAVNPDRLVYTSEKSLIEQPLGEDGLIKIEENKTAQDEGIATQDLPPLS